MAEFIEYDVDKPIPKILGDLIRGVAAARAARSGAPDSALGRCQVLIQCHRETGHEGRHEATEETA
jgi:hypothetical protein